MWIEPTKNGKYKACERYIDPFTGKARKVSITIDNASNRAKKSAKEALDAKIDLLTDAKRDEDITLEELSVLFIEHQKRNTKDQTWHRDAGAIGKAVDLIGKDVKARALSARYISNKLDSSGKSNITLNVYLKKLKQMLKWAYRKEYIDNVSYLDKLQPYPDRDKKSRIEEKYLTTDELDKLLQGIENDRYRLLSHFLALSGLRIGEALALRDADLDDVIHVNKTMDLRLKAVTSSAKTSAGNRDVFIQPELADLIRKIRLHNKVSSIRHGFRSDLFFPDNRGNYMNYTAYCRYLRKCTEDIIGRPLTPHALRHTHVSLLAENGVPLEVISRRVGHEDSDITKQIYLHITKRQKEKDNEMLSKIKIL